MRKAIFIPALCIAAVSCVSTRTFNSMKAEALRAQSDLSAAQASNRDMSARIGRLTAERDALLRDTARLFASQAGLQYKYDQLAVRYERLLADGSAEAARMLRQLEASQSELNARERRVAELEQALKAREEALDAIRRKVADALLGFEGKGLTVTQKGGKVYVSMEDKLLFRSGSFDIDPEGARAVRDLGTVLAQNPDINVVVEGHTDDVPYRASGQLLDNLDLSAKRATTVTRLLLENKNIRPERITAAGRGESLPVNPAKTAEARAKNRRTEIILTPKLDELLQLMDNKTVKTNAK